MIDLIHLFCRKNGIGLAPYSKSKKKRELLGLEGITNKYAGAVYKRGKNICIFYDDKCDNLSILHVLLHELGHILTNDFENIDIESKPIGMLEHCEFTAEVFACMVSALMFMDELKMLHSEEAAK